MLPDLPILKEKVQKALNFWSSERVRFYSGGFKDVNVSHIHEGTDSSMIRPTKEEDVTKPFTISGESQVKAADIEKGDIGSADVPGSGVRGIIGS